VKLSQDDGREDAMVNRNWLSVMGVMPLFRDTCFACCHSFSSLSKCAIMSSSSLAFR
jgi:hypothetical protein